MRSRIPAMRDAVRRGLASYKDAWAARPAPLAAYPDVYALLGALDDERPATFPVREEAVRTLLALSRETASPLWSQVLFVAFYPILSKLRGQVVGDALSPDDLDQTIVAAFFRAVGDVARWTCKYCVLQLVRRTRDIAFGALRVERAEHALRLDISWTQWANIADCASSFARKEEEREPRVGVVERVAKDLLPPRYLTVVLATVVRRERLRDYVARLFEPPEREAAYQRLKRMRSRALKRLRKALAAQELAA